MIPPFPHDRLLPQKEKRRETFWKAAGRVSGSGNKMGPGMFSNGTKGVIRTSQSRQSESLVLPMLVGSMSAVLIIWNTGPPFRKRLAIFWASGGRVACKWRESVLVRPLWPVRKHLGPVLPFMNTRNRERTSSRVASHTNELRIRQRHKGCR
jgi:hypothetical protein